MRRDLESAPTQQKVLNYLLDASERGEPPPTLEELAVALGQAAKSNMHRAVKQLLGKGYLEWDRAESRAKTRRIRPTEKAWALRSAIEKSESVAVEGELTTETDARLVPLLWRVAAGQPILADEENIREHLPLPRQHVRGAEVFMLEVMGDSMTGDGVLEGDYVVVVSDPAPRDGEMVVALVDGEATVKRLWHDAGDILLEAANPAYSPIRLSMGHEVAIQAG